VLGFGMRSVLLVGIGGFAGSVIRYLVSGIVQQSAARTGFPLGTLVVNLSGCFIIGLVSWLADMRSAFSSATRTFLLVGVLGGYTTFSTFGNESMGLLRDGQHLLAAANVCVQVLGGLAMVWAGRSAGQLVWR
jgi:CrcB protein